MEDKLWYTHSTEQFMEGSHWAMDVWRRWFWGALSGFVWR